MTAPFLKWAGGKRQLLHEILPLVGTPERYFEPFLGGGAVFFALRAAGYDGPATLSDANTALIDTYLAVRDNLEPLLAALREHATAHSEEHYYRVRDNFLPFTLIDRAARFIYLNRTCFNGLHRVNRAGKFNVPHGRYANPTICDEPVLRAASAALARANIHCYDFVARTIDAEDGRPGSVFYIDPPYLPVSETSNFSSYQAQAFGREEHARLAEKTIALSKRGARVIVSEGESDYVRQLYDGALSVKTVRAKRAINSKASRRGDVNELIISSVPGEAL